MPPETIYRPRTTPNAAAPMPLASAETYGGGVGRALGQLSETVHQTDVRAYRIERQQKADQERAAIEVKLAEKEAADAKRIEDERQVQPEGLAAHTRRAGALADDGWDDLVSGVVDDDLRRELTTRRASYKARIETREYGWQAVKQQSQVATDAETAIATRANIVRTSGDPAAYVDQSDWLESYVDGLVNVAPEVREKLRRYGQQQIGISYLEKLKDSDPVAAQALVMSGAFADVLTPEQTEAMLNGFGVEIRAKQVQAERAKATAVTDVRSAINTYQKQLADGVPVPDEELAKYQEMAKAAGLDSEVYDLGKARIINTANRVYQGALPQQLTAEIVRLDQKIAKAGDKPKAEDVILRDHLVSRRESTRGDIEKDPLGFASRAGVTVDPVDFSDAGSIQRRVSQAQSVAQSTGAPPRYLMPDEAEQLRDLASKGSKQKLEALAMLSQFGGKAARDAARQVAPADAVFQRAATLPPAYRALAINGAEAVKANPALIKPVDDDMKAAFGLQDGNTRYALRSVAGSEMGSVIETANQIMAGMLAAQGGGLPSASTRSKAINMALGADMRGGVQHGGLSRWNGRPFFLPDDTSAAMFEAHVMREAFRDPAKAPVNPDGTPANLRRAVPVWIGGDVYEFRTAGEAPVKARDGSNFRISARRKR
jgi:hypothetical protein